MGKHTPGPWGYEMDDYVTQVFVIDRDPGRLVIAEVNEQPEQEANARLMAAAPELLAALKRAEQAIHSEYCSTKCHAECVAVTDAIKKAEGQ